LTFIIVSNQSLLWLKNVLWKIKKIHSKSFRTKKTLEMEFCYIVWCNKQIIWLRTFSVLICYHTVHVYVVINVFDGVWSFLRGSESAGVLLLLIYICMVVDLYLYDCCWFISVWLLLIYICMVVVDLYLYGCCWFISVWLLLIYICMIVVDLYLYDCCWFISVWLLLIYICMVVVDLYLYDCCWFISVWLLLTYICMVVGDHIIRREGWGSN
jgi:hypothetical protein